jgi:hypothetical protein
MQSPVLNPQNRGFYFCGRYSDATTGTR